MLRVERYKRSSCGLLLAISVSAVPANAAPVTVGFDPQVSVVPLGQTITIDIFALIPDAIVGWGLDLTLTVPAVASLNAAPQISAPWIPVASADGDGLAAVSNPLINDGAVIGSQVLATLSFTADQVGITHLDLSVTAGDLTEGFPLDLSGFADHAFEQGTIQVLIPEPAVSILVLWLCLLSPRRRANIGAAGP